MHVPQSRAQGGRKKQRRDEAAEDAPAADEAKAGAEAGKKMGDGDLVAGEGEEQGQEGASGSGERAVDESVAPAMCGETGAPFKIGGPIWSEPMHDREWVLAALDRINSGVDKHVSTGERIHGVLTAVSEELFDVPLYYTLPDLCSTLHCASPKMAEVRAALMHAGYRSSQSHRDPDAIKTDAPPRVVWDMMRSWIKKHPISDKRLADPQSAVAKILAVEPRADGNFTTTAAMRAKTTKARRWAPNPEENWGPKAAAYGRKRPRPNNGP